MHDTAAASTESSHDARKLWELIKDIKFAMFTTRGEDGALHARPMTVQNGAVDEDAALWFFASRDGDVVRDVGAQPSVNVSFADPGSDCYVSVCGDARVVDDAAKKRQLWNKLAQAWFPGGVDDPDLALLRVGIGSADYWQSKDNKLTQLVKMATAAVTGKPPANMGEHGSVRMR